MTEERFVDPNTSDLDDFSDLFHGRAKEMTEEVEAATPEPVVEDEQDDTDDNAVESSEDETETEDQDDGDDIAPEPEKKPKSRFQERIDELTQKAREADTRARELERKFEELSKTKTEEAPKPKPVDNGPNPEDLKEDGSEKYPLGEFDPLYIRDLTRHTINQETARAAVEREEQEQAREMQSQQQKLYVEWQGRLEKAVESYPDMPEKNAVLEDTFANLDQAYGEYLATTIMSMDYGPDVLYYLGNNVEEAKRIASSGPVKATVALGRLEAKFADAAAEKVIKKPKVSDAPTPPPANKGGAVRKAIAADTDDLDAFSELFFSK